MKIELVKLEPEHVLELLAQDALAHSRELATPEALAHMAARPHTFTAFSETGKVVACGGVTEYWPGRAEAWMMFNQNCRREFIAVHNAVKKFLDSCPVKRIEAAVAVGFEAGHRWIKLLGFTMEAPLLRAYRPDGADCALYSRIRE